MLTLEEHYMKRVMEYKLAYGGKIELDKMDNMISANKATNVPMDGLKGTVYILGRSRLFLRKI